MKTDGGFRTTDPLPAEGLASWYVPGLMDGFGDRLLMFDNTDSDALEMLRFRAELVDTPGFEEVLHERVRRLRRLTNAAFPVIRAVEHLESDGSLVLVSTYMPGRRLSALLAEPRLGKGLHPAFVTWVVSQVIQSLSILQSEGDDFAHSALTADRILLTTDGQVRVVEHVLGSALRHLNCSPARLWRDFGLLVPVASSAIARLDARADVFQLGVLALSLLLARRVTPLDLEQRLPFLLDQWSTAATRARLFGDPLRIWLARALQIGDRPYSSAAEAYADLRRLPSTTTSRTFEFLQTGDIAGLATPRVRLESAAQAGGQEAPMANRFSLDRVQVSDSTPSAGTQSLVSENGKTDVEETLPVESRANGSRPVAFVGAEAAMVPKLPNAVVRMAASAFRSRGARLSVAVGLAAVAIAEAIVIAAMFVREPSTPTASTSAGAAPSAVEVSGISALAPRAQTVSPIHDAGLNTPNASAVSEQSRSTPQDSFGVERQKADALATAIAQAARNQRSGGVRLATPIELKVLQGERVLGSSADGPIVTTAGTYELDLINTSLGFRARRAVTFRAGEITTVSIAIPSGRISVNAEPWADVWIDNRPVGQTPLANLEVPIGEHELIFRHPELGERRQNVIVRADTVARASTGFDR